MNKVIGSIVVASMVSNLFAAGWGQMGKAVIGKVAAEGAKNIATETPNNTAAVSSKEEVRRRQFIEQLKAMDNQKRQKTLGWLKSKNPAEFVAVMTMIKQEQGATKANAGQGEKKEIAKNPETESQEAKQAIETIEDDAQFFTAFKGAINDADNAKKKSLFERACQMKDESLLVEFLTAYPDQASAVADKWYSKICFDHIEIKTSKFAELLLDNMKGLDLCRLVDVMFHAAKALDATTRAKYLKIADENLSEARKDEDMLVVERYYIGMPVIDYVMRALQEKHNWTTVSGDDNPVDDRLSRYADMKTEIALDDWKKEWKIKYLVFTSKERSKIFKTKGTMDGFVEFLKKYVDKSATIKDITVEGGWWIYLDDPHELKVSLNDNNGALNIYRQR